MRGREPSRPRTRPVRSPGEWSSLPCATCTIRAGHATLEAATHARSRGARGPTRGAHTRRERRPPRRTLDPAAILTGDKPSEGFVTEQDRPGGQQDRRVAVIGLGYVGLPLAISFAEAGLRVEGVDAYQARVDELDAGHSPIDDVSDE